MEDISKQMKILVVDDSEHVTSVMKKFFREYDLEVFTCNNGLGGIKIAVEEKPNLIFLDLSMPRMDGYDTMKVLKSIDVTKSIPIIVITAHDDNKSITNALKEGAAKVIVKPITKKAIMIEMEQIFGYNIFSNIQAQRQNASEEKKKNDDDKILADDSDPFSKTNILKSLIRSVDTRVKDINTNIQVKNEVQLKSILFELAGISKALGISRLSSISDYIIRQLMKPADELNWPEIEKSTENVVSFLKQLKTSNSHFL